MKTMKDWKKEIEGALKEKGNEAFKTFQAHRDKDFEDLIQLSEQLHAFEVKLTVAKSQQEMESKKFIPLNSIMNETDRKIFYFQKNIAGVQKQIDALFKKLTSYPESIREIYPFMKLIQG